MNLGPNSAIKSFLTFFLAMWLASQFGWAKPASGMFHNRSEDPMKKLHYQSHFGNCPTRNIGALTFVLVNEFKRSGSLFELKKKIVNEKLERKHFLSTYEITYNPVGNVLKFSFDCPLPLMRVQIYKNLSQEFYDAILVENGELYDPTYEILFRNERKIDIDLPYLALPFSNTFQPVRKEVAFLIKDLPPSFRKKISEVILDRDSRLTFIMAINGSATSVFLGDANWMDKLRKVQKIISYMEQKKKIPSVINLTNSKKVVVKFPDSF